MSTMSFSRTPRSWDVRDFVCEDADVMEMGLDRVHWSFTANARRRDDKAVSLQGHHVHNRPLLSPHELQCDAAQ
jgi:hypothetical protein